MGVFAGYAGRRLTRILKYIFYIGGFFFIYSFYVVPTVQFLINRGEQSENNKESDNENLAEARMFVVFR